MIELTPLDVRKKKGDFRRGLRGYEAAQVDDFLDIVADRMEVLVREAAAIHERVSRLEQEVAEYRDREKAMTEALVTAQQMRETIRNQSTREVEMMRNKAEQEAAQLKADASKAREREEEAFRLLRVRQAQFLASYKTFLEHELGDLAAMTRSLEEWARTGTPPAGMARPEGGATAAAMAAAAAVQGTAPTTAPSAGAEEPITAPEPDEAPAKAQTPAARKADTRKAAKTAAPPRKVDDELDAQLAQALARWEPELEKDQAKPVPVTLNDMADPELEAEDEVELLLDDDDVVPAAPPAKAPEAPKPKGPRAPLIDDLINDDDEIDAELAELLGPEPSRGAKPAPRVEPPRAEPPRAEPPRREPATATPKDMNGDVNAAMGKSAESFIDLDEAFGEPPPEPLRTPPADPLADMEEMFEDAPAASDEASPRANASGASLIDLENYGALENYGSAGVAEEGDGANLTLHPMFYDKDSTEIPAMIRPDEKKRNSPTRWSGGDKG